MAAPKGNNFAEGNEGGRPTDYKEEYNDQVYKLCLLGATDSDIANFFQVTETTINNWKIKYEMFFESIKKGKIISDMEVAYSMYSTTKDREVTELKGFKLKRVYYNDEGKRIEEERIELAEETRVIPADFRSMSLWLRNRKSDSWRDRQEVDHTSKGDKIQYISLGHGINPEENNAESIGNE